MPGDRLPSVRDLALELGVSPNTVAAAYKQLRDRGVVVGRGRQGTIVAPLNRPTFSQLASVPDGAIDALRGSPDPAMLPDLGRAFEAATTNHNVRYGDHLLDDSFASAAGELFSSDGIDATNLTTTSGAMDAIEKILSTNDLRPGDRVGVEDPGHIPVHQLVRAAGLEVVPLAMDDEGIRPDVLRDVMTKKLAALIVTPRAQNPTGAAFSKKRAEVLSDILAGHRDLVLIQDDHAGSISGSDWIGLRAPGPRYGIIRSLGKSLGPDLRISITVGDAATIDGMALAVSNGPGWVSHVLQRAAAYLLADASTMTLVQQAALSYSDRRRRLVAALARHGVESSGASGINVWIPVVDEQVAVEAARAAGFAIRAGDMYRISSAPAVRVTIANLNVEEIECLADALAGGVTTHHSPAM
jgi:DNA-binding transcriptional MocR family regulator